VTLANKPPALIVPGIFISFDTTKTRTGHKPVTGLHCPAIGFSTGICPRYL